MTPDDLAKLLEFVHQGRSSEAPFDAAVIGTLPSLKQGTPKGAAKLAAFQEAGATWWIEAMWSIQDPEEVEARIQQGPPRLTKFPG